MHRSILISFLTLLGCAAGEDQRLTLDVLCYHDVRDGLHGHLDEDPFAVSTDTLVSHFSWLREHDFHPVTLGQVEAAREGQTPLPPRAVLLTFDDGYSSAYTRVYPLLKLFRFPALFAVVGRWIEEGKPPRDEFPVSRGLITWDQAREMQDSGLVEFASHSWDLHYRAPTNDAGTVHYAMVSRIWDPGGHTHETTESYLSRVRLDLETSVRVMTQKLGAPPRAVVWPYGESTELADSVALELGMRWQFTLGTPSGVIHRPTRIDRHLILANPPVQELASLLAHRDPSPAIRAIRLDLESLSPGTSDAGEWEKSLDRLMDRMVRLRPNLVILSAANSEGKAWFPSNYLPLERDLFSRVASLLSGKAAAQVYARIPSQIPASELPTFCEDLASLSLLNGIVFSARHAASPEVRTAVERAKKWRPELKTGIETTLGSEPGGFAGDRRIIWLPVLPETGWKDQVMKCRRLAESDRERFIICVDAGSSEVPALVDSILAEGIRHVGYGPDDPLGNQPPLEALTRIISTEDNPFRKR